MNTKENRTIGEIVADNYKTASVFQKHGIDFCCKGGRSLDDVCESKNLDKSALMQEIQQALNSENSDGEKMKDWPLDRLIDHIESKHHRYVEEAMPAISTYLYKLCKVHGNSHPELHEVYELFTASSGDLAVHMKKEELVLFPFIKKMWKWLESGEKFQVPHFNTVQNPIVNMKHDHDVEGERFRRISEITNNYTTPPEGCNTYHVAMNMLRDFEEDLHIHVHLENNILFPKARILETELKNG